MTRALPQFVRDLLASCPSAGTGVHAWLFRAARQLHAHYPDKAELARLLEAASHGCGRHVSESEIREAIANSEHTAWQPGGGNSATRPQSKWPEVNQEQRAAIIRDGGGLADLWELSRPRLEDAGQHMEAIIDRLFPGNPLLCCGVTDYNFATRTREEWRGKLVHQQLIVPSPMSAPHGLTKKGKNSAHSLNNTGPRRFLVVEFDTGTTDEHAALLLHLGTFAPLVCAVHSGGKSLHGWFFVSGQPDEMVLRFFRYAVSLGADDQLWCKTQFCRMPDGTRSNGNRQTVFYLNFNPIKTTDESLD